MAMEITFELSEEDLEYFQQIMHNARQKTAGLSEAAIRSYDLANPLGMSADGLFRYWNKTRSSSAA